MTTTPVRDMMFRGFEKSGLLSAEEEISLSRQYHASKKEIWLLLLGHPEIVDLALRVFRKSLSPRMRRELNDDPLFDLEAASRGILVSQTSYRQKRWESARVHAVEVIAPADANLRAGAKLIEMIESDKMLIDADLKRRLLRERRLFTNRRNEFIEKNMRLVMKIVNRYKRFNVPYEDMIQEGTFGLQRAVDLFDPELKYKFSTYASWWIRANVQRYCQEKSKLVRVPSHMQEAFEKYLLVTDKEKDLDDESIADRLSISKKKVRVLRKLQKDDYLSLDTKVFADSSESRIDSFTNDEDPFRISDANIDMEVVSRVVADLPARQRYIIECRFGLNGREETTLQEIANGYELSRERVRQLQNKALNSIRKRIERRAEAIQAGLNVEP